MIQCQLLVLNRLWVLEHVVKQYEMIVDDNVGRIYLYIRTISVHVSEII
jgi:hypothetical protein